MLICCDGSTFLNPLVLYELIVACYRRALVQMTSTLRRSLNVALATVGGEEGAACNGGRTKLYSLARYKSNKGERNRTVK